jgi:very-short-patch-repair endonuclease
MKREGFFIHLVIVLFIKCLTMVYTKRTTEAKQNHGASLNIRSKAKELRNNMTESEVILWDHLRKRKLNGTHFRRQHPYGIYILDFYSYEANLAIEIDGPIHLDQQEYDIDRTKDLESSGMKLIRFTNSDIRERIEWVLDMIKSYLPIK